MGVMNVLGRLAAKARVPVFAAGGTASREVIHALRLSPELELVETPSAANVLVVVGDMPPSVEEALARVHDAMSYPRCTVVGHQSTGSTSPDWPFVHRSGDDLANTIRQVHAGLLAGRLTSDPPVLPDVDAAPWRGVGPYGQGGSGMTGGTPYGRPMAELRPDRDGLRLDALPLRIGPFLPPLPTGLVLDVTFAGDVVVEATVAPTPFAGVPDAAQPRPGLRPFVRALVEPVPVAALEVARAREHLAWVADALVAHGLPAMAHRALRLARDVRPGDARLVARFARFVERTQVLRWSTSGVGRLEAAQLAGLGLGPVSRAAALAEDARLEDPAYRRLGYEPLLGTTSDATARWRLRLAEAGQSLELAERAGELYTTPTGRVESPRGRLEAGSAPGTRLLPLVPELITELEWGDAVATLVSLDLDPEETGFASRRSSGEEAA
jgi:hypothetical protein